MERDYEQNVPTWLEASLSPEEIGRIEQAVKDAERGTSAEIVPMIVHRSTLKGTGDRILFWISFAFLGVGGAVSLSLIGGLDDKLLDRVLTAFSVWPSPLMHTVFKGDRRNPCRPYGCRFGVDRFLSFYRDSISLTGLFFPSRDLTIEAEHRAQAEFFASDLRSTTGRTGVLLFVSMLEHRAVILADEAIVAKFDPATWTNTLSTLIESIRNGEMGKGYVVAIQSIGKTTANTFPAHDK